MTGDNSGANLMKELRQPKKIRCWVTVSRLVVDNKWFVAFFMVMTIYALIGSDVQLILFNKDADEHFNVITLCVLFLFSIELVISCLGKDDYFMGFFFGLDLVSTITLILDLTWVSEVIIGDEEDLDRARSGRTARLGARAGRIVRILRLIRIVKLYKAYYESRAAKQNAAKRSSAKGDDADLGNATDSWDLEDQCPEMEDEPTPVVRESLVGKKLSGLTTRNVIFLVLTMMIVMPLLQANDAMTMPSSAAYGADEVWEKYHLMIANRSTISADVRRTHYEKAMLKYVYYHNWFTGNGGCPVGDCTSSASPHLYLSHLFWVGLSSSSEELVALHGDEAQLRSSTVMAYNEEVQQQDFIYNYGTLPSQVLTILSDPWREMPTPRCRMKTRGSEIILRGFSVIQAPISGEVDHAVLCPNDLRIQERMKFSPIVMPEDQWANQWHFAFYFDLRPYVKEESTYNLWITFFVCIVLVLFSVIFSNDANKLILNPVEEMISKVEKIRDNPLSAIQLADAPLQAAAEAQARKARQSPRQNAIDALHNILSCKFSWPGAESSKEQPMETVIIEKTIIKLGSLLAIGFGEAGANIVSQNMKNSNEGVNAMIPGRRVDAIIGNARIRDFSTATEVLQGKVMRFVNQIAEIVHGVVDEFHGAANKNNGDTFLLIWRTSAEDSTSEVKKLADMSVCALARMIGGIHQSPLLGYYRGHPGLQQRLGSSYRVNLSFGLHFGWAIEGAVGSEFKIDASYLSPNVSIALAVESATQIYGVHVLVSQTVVELCNQPLGSKCRLIDKVVIKGSKTPIQLYSVDLDFMSLQVQSDLKFPWNARKRFQARQLIETEKTKKLDPKFDIEPLWNENATIVRMRRRYTEEFLQWFNMGYQNYAEGEWDIARTQLMRAQNILGHKDGPICALLRFMETPHSFEAPKDWQGQHPLVLGADREYD